MMASVARCQALAGQGYEARKRARSSPPGVAGCGGRRRRRVCAGAQTCCRQGGCCCDSFCCGGCCCWTLRDSGGQRGAGRSFGVGQLRGVWPGDEACLGVRGLFLGACQPSLRWGRHSVGGRHSVWGPGEKGEGEVGGLGLAARKLAAGARQWAAGNNYMCRYSVHYLGPLGPL